METKQNKDDIYIDSSYSFKEILFILKKHFKTISLVFFIVNILVITFTLTSDQIYKSSSTIIINKDPNSLSMLNMGYNGDRNFIDNEIGILRSRTTSEKVIKRILNKDNLNLHLFNKEDIENLSNEQLINKYSNKLRRSLYISNNKRTDAINISIESKDPNEAAMLVNTLIDVYKERDLEWVTGEMSHLKNFLLKQL